MKSCDSWLGGFVFSLLFSPPGGRRHGWPQDGQDKSTPAKAPDTALRHRHAGSAQDDTPPPRPWAVVIRGTPYTRSDRCAGTRALRLPKVVKDTETDPLLATLFPQMVLPQGISQSTCATDTVTLDRFLGGPNEDLST